MPDVFFLVEERRDRANEEAGQVSQPVRACEPGLGDLFKPTAPAYFWGVKLIFVGVVNFGHVQLLRFVVLKIFGHVLTLILVVLIQSSNLACLNFFCSTYNFQKVIFIVRHFIVSKT